MHSIGDHLQILGAFPLVLIKDFKVVLVSQSSLAHSCDRFRSFDRRLRQDSLCLFFSLPASLLLQPGELGSASLHLLVESVDKAGHFTQVIVNFVDLAVVLHLLKDEGD